MLDSLKVHRDFVLDPSLVLYLPLYELDGSKFASKDAYGHLATVTGALWRPNGRYFNGTNAKIEFGTPAELQFTTDTSILVWAKLDNVTTTYCFVAKSNVAGEDRFQFRALNTGQLGAFKESANDGGVSFSGGKTSTEWAFYELEFGSGSMQVFINLKRVSSNANTAVLTAGTHINFRVGEDYNDSNDMKGTIGEVLVYTRTLSFVERTHIYEATKWRYQ